MKDTERIEITLDDAIKCVEVATALGAEVQAPNGTVFFDAGIYWDKKNGLPYELDNLGYYSSESQALDAIVDSILEICSDEFNGPWITASIESPVDWEDYVALRSEYFKVHSKEEFLTEYLVGGGYVIRKRRIGESRY